MATDQPRDLAKEVEPFMQLLTEAAVEGVECTISNEMARSLSDFIASQSRELELATLRTDHHDRLVEIRSEYSAALAAKDARIAELELQIGAMYLEAFGPDALDKLRLDTARLDKLPAVREAMSDKHPDELAVAKFASAMNDKLAEKRDEGKYGWDDPDVCSIEFLWNELAEHVINGDPIDIANFAMMIWCRNLDIRNSVREAIDAHQGENNGPL